MNRKIFKWEDLSVLGENKERGHAIAFSYDNKEDACKKKEVKTKYSVDCICGYVCSCKPV